MVKILPGILKNMQRILNRFILVFTFAMVLNQTVIAVENSKPNIKQQSNTLAAFPGAQGYGALAVGGRGGRILEVTNLADSGPGSLRAAIAAEGPRTIVFKVAGTIYLQDKLRIRTPFLTIAGQTAPGDGITLVGVDSSLLQISAAAHDIVIRYLRLRNGSGEANGSGHDNISINAGYNIIIDHVSMSWSSDENLSIYKKSKNRSVYDVTVQRSLLAEGLAGHSNGLLVSGQVDKSDPQSIIENWRDVYNISIHHNLFAHNSHRNPRVTSAGAQVINNVVYNWRARVGSTTRGSILDLIGNYFKAGPMSDLDKIFLHENFNPKRPLEVYPPPSIFSHSNIVQPGALDLYADNWRLHRLNYLFLPLPTHYRRTIALPQATIPITNHTAFDAYAAVLGDVGANARLDCLGNWLVNSDVVDNRIITEVLNGTGPTELAATGELVEEDNPGVLCADRDHDGMPDEWENIYGFDADDYQDGINDIDEDGYTNLEEYLNGTDPHF